MFDFIQTFNAKAELERPEFRRRSSGKNPSIFDQDFFETRTNFPHFGYVTCRNTDASDFYMFDNNDDAVAKHWYWYGKDGYERSSSREWIKRAKSATVVFDIGAHTGAFTFMAARSNPAITALRAFEPTARAYSRLTENLIVNCLLDKARPERLAVSNQPGQLQFNLFDDLYQIGTGNSYKTEHTYFHAKSHEICQATTIDAYVHDNGLVPDLVKMDVEGAELDALDGAAELVARRSASFLIEVTPANLTAVTEVFRDYRISLIDDDEDRLVEYSGQNIDDFVNLVIDPE